MATPESIYSLAQIQSEPTHNVLGHSKIFAYDVCSHLNISCIQWAEVQHYADLGINIHKQNRHHLPVLPALALMPSSNGRPGHVVLLTANVKREQVFSLE